MDISARAKTGSHLRMKAVHDRLRFYITPMNLSLDSFAESVRIGLTAESKFLQPKYFYDEIGSKLFERICEQPEYYLTDLETTLLLFYSKEIAKLSGCQSVVELGSGNSKKTRHLLDALFEIHDFVHYTPIDVSYEILDEGSRNLLREYERLYITGIVSEYERGLSVVKNNYSSGKLVVFLGSSIGNMAPSEAKKFIHTTREYSRDNDMFLMGVDMHKDSRILNAAYNDSKGITARFNMNILARINRELNANFALDQFKHRAFYNEPRRRVEMHLVSRKDQEVNIEGIGETIAFARGETIHTENSYKFTDRQIEDIIEGDFKVIKSWTDTRKWYGLVLLAPI